MDPTGPTRCIAKLESKKRWAALARPFYPSLSRLMYEKQRAVL